MGAGVTSPSPRPLTRQRVEHTLDLLAGIIAGRKPEDAARFAPIYDRLERELAAMPEDDNIQNAAKLPAKLPVVYFIRSGEFIKIGRSSSWPTRYSDLRNNSPHPIVPLLVMRAKPSLETKLHARFKPDRVKGEWFRPSYAIMDYVERHRPKDIHTQLLRDT